MNEIESGITECCEHGTPFLVDCKHCREIEAEDKKLVEVQMDTKTFNEMSELRRICNELLIEIEEISCWRKSAIEYDKDQGNPERVFCEDVELIEQHANLIFKKYYEQFHGI